MKYLLRRLLHIIFLLVGVSALSFAFLAVAPGNFLDDMRLNPQVSPDTVAALRVQYGLDRPVAVRYLRWIEALFHGDLGYSFAYNQPTIDLLLPRARNTLELTATATAIAWLLALPIGIWVAAHPKGFADRCLSVGTAALLGIPDLLLLLLFVLGAAYTNRLPAGGMTSVDYDSLVPIQKFKDLAAHFLLPVSVLILGSLPTLLRHIRAAVAKSLGEPFLTAGTGHGISKSRLLFRYALPIAANPLISLFGFSVGALLSMSLLIEVVLGWPGLGPLLLEAILSRDVYVVIGAVMCSSLFLVAGVSLSDLLLYWHDPRIRMGHKA
jgi:peptide/nickel transport system permease protein